MNLRYRFITLLAAACSMLTVELFAQESYVCVWRNPEVTMRRIFRTAKDYRTVIKKISPAQRKVIEKELGQELLPGQRDIFQYYEMLDSSSSVIGYIIAASQKGKYGAIEFVFGTDTDMVIKKVYIQRARERDREFKKKEFLDFFAGKAAGDVAEMEIGDTGAKETVGTLCVLNGIRKELIAYDVLDRKPPAKEKAAEEKEAGEEEEGAEDKEETGEGEEAEKDEAE